MLALRRPRALVMVRSTKSETGRAAKIRPAVSREKVMAFAKPMTELVEVMWTRAEGRANRSDSNGDLRWTADRAGGQETTCRGSVRNEAGYKQADCANRMLRKLRREAHGA